MTDIIQTILTHHIDQWRPPEKSLVGTGGMILEFFIQNRFKTAARYDEVSHDTLVRT